MQSSLLNVCLGKKTTGFDVYFPTAGEVDFLYNMFLPGEVLLYFTCLSTDMERLSGSPE